MEKSDFLELLEDIMIRTAPRRKSMESEFPELFRSLGLRVAPFGTQTALTIIRTFSEILERVGVEGLERIAGLGIRIAQNSRGLGIAFFESSAHLIDGLSAFGDRRLPLEVYALCDRLCAISWRAAVGMLDQSRDIIGRVGFKGLEKITEISIHIAPFCWLTAEGNFEKCLHLMDRLAPLGKEDLALNVLSLVAGVSRNSWQTAVCLLEQSPRLFDRIGYDGLASVAGLVDKIARHSWLAAVKLIEKTPPLIDELLEQGDLFLVLDIFDCCSRAARSCWRIAPALLEDSPGLVSRIGLSGFELMAGQACELSRISPERALSFIRAESREGAEFMNALSENLDLFSVKPVLANYLNALLRFRIEIAAAGSHFTDGRKIFLPERIGGFGDRISNFTAYKVFATHEEAHLEYGSFEFSLSRIPEVIERIKAKYDGRT
jgi:hypothetical protein